MTPGGDGGAIPDIVHLLYLLGTLAILLSTLFTFKAENANHTERK